MSWSANGQDVSGFRADPELARALYANGYYMLSALEWSRMITHETDPALASAGQIELAYALWRMDEVEPARILLDTLASDTALQPAFRAHAQVLLTTLHLHEGAFRAAATTAAASVDGLADEQNGMALAMQKVRVAAYLAYDERAEAARLWRSLPGTDDTLAEEWERHAWPFKSPRRAGVFSALLPGAGQAYVGRWQEAGAAFTVNAVLAAAAYEAYDNNLPLLGTSVALAGLTWYVGNIFNAMNVAHKHNDETRAYTVNDWLRRLDIGLTEDTIRAAFRKPF